MWFFGPFLAQNKEEGGEEKDEDDDGEEKRKANKHKQTLIKLHDCKLPAGQELMLLHSMLICFSSAGH